MLKKKQNKTTIDNINTLHSTVTHFDDTSKLNRRKTTETDIKIIKLKKAEQAFGCHPSE